MTENNFYEELEKININLTNNQKEQFKKYYDLLISWNEKINLTAITDKNDVYLKHFYDSSTLSKIINLNEVNSLCDIGTGAGFPGIVLKILFPNLEVTLIDSLEKRIKFLNIVIEDLGLEKINTIHSRIEDYGINNREKFDVVTARAVAALPVLMEYCTPLVKTGKYFIPMKANISQEIENSANAMNKLSLSKINQIEFLLPYENSNRCLILYRKNKETNKNYPRKNSEIKRKPL